MAKCLLCGNISNTTSASVGLCLNCIRTKPDEVIPIIIQRHANTRAPYNLPPEPPKGAGLRCAICANGCVLKDGDVGFCGLRYNIKGRLVSLSTTEKAPLHYYLDPHITNCCAAWFCPAGTGSGYPKYACKNGPEYGYYNLAIFFYGCNFNCLFCQNWSHKEISSSPQVTTEELLNVTLKNDRITCWCFFGGSPEPHLPFAINASRKVLESIKDRRIMRICFEWNGCGNEHLVKRCGELAFVSGGNIKFDLKTFDPILSLALSGVKNDRAYRNFSMLFNEFYRERKDLPVLTATTLLVSGYVDEKEVENIAKFIAEHDENIPYSLLIFHPDYMMRDLTITPVSQVKKCLYAAKKYLKNVNVGNMHLLSIAPP
ncbi:MAG: radical SAM protein [Nitrososphaerota archaeon]|nr:radical SAM protein [Aigarchaeota archaeon]MDW8077116.1 radical SAM protein [Nitrososphaerota archaeon]